MLIVCSCCATVALQRHRISSFFFCKKQFFPACFGFGQGCPLQLNNASANLLRRFAIKTKTPLKHGLQKMSSLVKCFQSNQIKRNLNRRGFYGSVKVAVASHSGSLVVDVALFAFTWFVL